VPHEHAMGDLDPVRELHTGQNRHGGAQTGRTDGSIRLRGRHPPIRTCAEGGVHRGEAASRASPMGAAACGENPHRRRVPAGRRAAFPHRGKGAVRAPYIA